MRKNGHIKRFSLCSLLLYVMLLYGCAHTDIQLGSIPAPPTTNKLRVVVYPVSSNAPWLVPHDMYAKKQYQATARFLNLKGIYEVVTLEDVQAVLGREWIAGWKFQQDDWALARQTAKALHADYLLLPERTRSGPGTNFWDLVLINAESGRRFSHTQRVPGGKNPDYQAVIKEIYGGIFRAAKGDMLANAIRKGRVLQKIKERTSSAPTLPVTATKPGDEPGQQHPPDIPAIEKAPDIIRELVKSSPGEDAAPGKTKMVVYDLSAGQNLQVVALLLSEALREELYLLGRFTLVNRDNVSQIMEELKLKQSGLVDEKNAVQIGKWFAARESVTGRLEVLGNTYLLYARRIDIETLVTLGVGSIKCPVGEEESLLKEMQNLARKLLKSP